MRTRNTVLTLTLAIILLLSGCHKSKVQNPIANIDSKQPDKVLYDRAMDAMKHNKFDVARLSLQTLINTYPDSEYIARAKLSVADAWYNEGGASSFAQAEVEYKDFITFFPNMPEAAEAQLKVANIHYRQMEKPDRDFTHAKRAEDEYRALITQFPDSKLVAEAKARLLEVQEVLAEREFRIGRFYLMRESYPAAIARLKSLMDTYPLYSQADEALFMLGQAYEREKEIMQSIKGDEGAKAQMVKEFTDKAADIYSQIITKYPLEPRAVDAKERLKALFREVPTPTAEAIAFDKQLQQSRSEMSRFGKMMYNFRRGPDLTHAAKVGDPAMEDPKATSAPEIVKNMYASALLAADRAAKTGNANTNSAEVVTGVKPGPNEAAPRSDTTKPITTPKTPNDPGTAPLPPPAQVNDANTPDQNPPAAKDSTTADGKKDDKKDDKKDESTSKKKKKGFFRRIIPGGSS